MDLPRAVYSRDLKIAAMRALDAGARTGEIARKYQLSPHLLERWRGEWRAKGESAFPGMGRRGADLSALDDARRVGELERKIGQLTASRPRCSRETISGTCCPRVRCTLSLEFRERINCLTKGICARLNPPL